MSSCHSWKSSALTSEIPGGSCAIDLNVASQRRGSSLGRVCAIYLIQFLGQTFRREARCHDGLRFLPPRLSCSSKVIAVW
jgi:hypothetical protein